MKRFFIVLMAMMIAVGSASVQEVTVTVEDNNVTGKAYIYCIVSLDDIQVKKEEKIHNYTRTYKERAYTLKIDCRQDDSDLISFYGKVTDNEGNPREFNSHMAGLNWLGMMGWEMVPYPIAYRSDTTIISDYWFRLDVTGLTAGQINDKLSQFGVQKQM